MIKNEKQYKTNKRNLIAFDGVIKHLEKELKKTPSELTEIQIAALRSQYEELNDEIIKYESLKNGSFNVIAPRNFENLHEIIIESRIASNLTQKQLAEKLGLKEQQIQRYESDDYSSASYSKMRQICEVLGIKLWFERIILINSQFSLPEEISKENAMEFQDKVKERGYILAIE